QPLALDPAIALEGPGELREVVRHAAGERKGVTGRRHVAARVERAAEALEADLHRVRARDVRGRIAVADVVLPLRLAVVVLDAARQSTPRIRADAWVIRVLDPDPSGNV